MRMSCNGCRVLRKGCSEDCSLKPCLQWIKSPESQANATVFLAKFYGRAGLVNLVNAGPSHLRPAIFMSLLHEACGRIINPVYGSVGLMCSGDWQRCQAAVEDVLSGAPLVTQQPGGSDDVNSSTITPGQRPVMPFQGCDIRHIPKDAAAAANHHRIRTRNRGKRSATQAKIEVDEEFLMSESEAKFTITGWHCSEEDDQNDVVGEERERATSHDSLFSVETVEPTLAKPRPNENIELGLTLGFNPAMHKYFPAVIEISDSEA